MIEIEADPTLPKDMVLAIREARSLLSICIDEAESKDILPTLKRFDAILARADAQHY